ncbi:ATP-dependent DNA helicase Rep [compost metagenome]
MAQMIPPLSVCIPRMKTSGEKRLARLLHQLLEDDYLVWYDIPVGRKRRYPDFIILHPVRGLLFLEVKDWHPSTLKRVNHQTCTLLTPQGLKEDANPLEQGRQMAYQVVDALSRNPRLRQENSRFKGNLACPYGWGAVFTNISRQQIHDGIPEAEECERVLPDHQVLYKDDLEGAVDSEAFQERLWRMFNVSFPCQLSLPQIDSIRWHLFPEIRVGGEMQTELFASTEEIKDVHVLPDIIKVMDVQQEVLARSLGEGHRVIHGVAGSGKTLILAFRCLYLAQTLNKPILVLCFNIPLAARLRHFLVAKSITDRVQVYHFHDWCGQQLKTYQVDVEDGLAEYFDRQVSSVINGVEQGRIPLAQYGAVLIDEGHDFLPEWLTLATQMVDPETNSLLLLYDDAQSIYRKRSALKFSLASVGIQAQGRTTILRLNYRNSREILQFAYRLARSYMVGKDADDIPLIAPEAAGNSGLTPALKRASDLKAEIAYVVRCVTHWHSQGKAWRDIALLYPGGSAGRQLSESLNEAGVPHAWLGSSAHKRRYDTDAEQIAVMTIHSSKGLEFSTVVVVDASYLHDEEAVAEQIRLLYVGCTRARDQLLVSYHRENAISTAFEDAIAG